MKLHRTNRLRNPLVRSSFLVLIGLLNCFVQSDASAQNLVNQPSGIRLGTNSFETQWGPRITGTVPGTPAHGRLFKDDYLTGAYVKRIYRNLRTNADLENAKIATGIGNITFRVWRPSLGRYVNVVIRLQPAGPITQNSLKQPKGVIILNRGQAPRK